RVLTRIGTHGGDPAAIVLQPDSRLVVAGSGSESRGFVLVRYLQNGDLDPSFGEGGIATNPSNVIDGSAVALDLILLPHCRLIAAGSVNVAQHTEFAIVRFNRDGTVDDNFGRNGAVLTWFGGDDAGSALLQQTDSKLIVAGNTTVNGTPSIALARYFTSNTR